MNAVARAFTSPDGDALVHAPAAESVVLKTAATIMVRIFRKSPLKGPT
jgi:hypothetical protein